MSLSGSDILKIFVFLMGMLLISYLRVRLYREKTTNEPEKTVTATVASKDVKEGTFDTGRSNYGYSYVITFMTEEGQMLELYAYEMEFGALKKDMRGLLTYKGRYFVNFKSEGSSF